MTSQIDHDAFDRATQLVVDIASEGDALTSSSAERLDALLSALDKLPRYRGLSYRGYAVIGRRGRDLSAVSEHVEELDPDNGPDPTPQFTLEQLEGEVRDAVREARELVAIEVTSPASSSAR